MRSVYQKIPSNDTQLYKKVKRSCYFDKTLMIKEIIMNVYIGLIIIIAFLLICFMGIKVIKNKKVVLISVFLIILVGIMGIVFIKISNNEQYIRVNENNQEVSIKLKNHKEYYGYKFYRFSSFNSENEIIKELKQNGYDTHYNQDDKKIIISYQNDIFEIKMEEKEKNLFRNHYNYIFSRQNN